jgi:hypothetical protein
MAAALAPPRGDETGVREPRRLVAPTGQGSASLAGKPAGHFGDPAADAIFEELRLAEMYDQDRSDLVAYLEWTDQSGVCSVLDIG